MSTEVEQELIEALQGDEGAIQRVAARLQGTPQGGAVAVTPEQFDEAVRHRARGLSEKIRFDAHFPDIVEDEEMYSAALALDAEMYRRHPNMSERERFSAVGEAVRRGYGQDIDYATHIAAEQRRRRRAEERAGEGDENSQPTAADRAIQESEAEYQSNVSQAMAEIVRGRGPKILPPPSEAERLRRERLELEKRRRAQGW